jgi:hypothetical protein
MFAVTCHGGYGRRPKFLSRRWSYGSVQLEGEPAPLQLGDRTSLRYQGSSAPPFLSSDGD